MAVRTASTRSAGAQTQPIFQPVHEKVLPPDEIVIVRSRMPGNVASGTCSPSNTRCSYTSSVTAIEVVLHAELGDQLELRRRLNTLPVGLCGELSRSSRVRGVIAARERVGVERPVGRAQLHDASLRAGHARCDAA